MNEKRDVYYIVLVLVFALIFLSFNFQEKISVELAPAAPYDCVVNDGNGDPIYAADNNERMWVLAGYEEQHILCYENQWWEEGSINDWQFANDVPKCTQKGNWYINNEHISSSTGIWKQGTLPSSCQQQIVLTCEQVDFNCDGVVSNIEDGLIISNFLSGNTGISNTIANNLITNNPYNCPKFGNYIQSLVNIGETDLTFTRMTQVYDKMIQCGSYSHYSFENNANNVINNKNGVATSITYSSGFKGLGGNFNGINSNVFIGNFNELFGKSFSVSMFVKPNYNYNALNQNQLSPFVYFSNQDSSKYFSINQHFNNVTAVLMNTNNGNEWKYGSYSFSSGNWIHVVAVYNKTSDKITLYVNGTQANLGNGNGLGGLSGTSGNLYFGKALNYYFNGMIDEVKVYNRTLSLFDVLNECGSICRSTPSPGPVSLSGKRVIYVTKSKWNGNFTFNSSKNSELIISGNSGVARADDICNKDPSKPKTGMTFKALIGTQSRNKDGSDWILSNKTLYYNPNGEVIGMTGNNKWYEFPLNRTISTQDYNVITGLTDSGRVNSENCFDYSTSNSSRKTGIGDSDSLNEEVIEEDDDNCDKDYHIYCVEFEGSGQAPICEPQWQNGSWSQTVNGIGCGVRTVTDLNNCGVLSGKPETTKTCPSQSLCGDRSVGIGETCDDGNIISGDGCSSTCQREIIPEPESECGNSIEEDGEECDDANTRNGDGCSSTCDEEVEEELDNSFWIYGFLIGIIILVILILIVVMFKKMKRRHEHHHGGVQVNSLKRGVREVLEMLQDMK